MSLKYQALIKQYEADALAAKAMLEVYFNESVGIGEHPQILEEMDSLVEKLATAQGKLESLFNLVQVESEEENEEVEE
jgi:predicted RND superfamily exporter protein